VFNTHHSETAMLRYLRALSDRDFALDRGMIPLGSCTMKLNATTEMEPISYPGFAELHPFVPAEDAQGYATLVEELEGWLAELTGYAAVSIQPNAGSQGELAGLLAIRGYHRANGDEQRTVCLIPSSAHGTNAASAVMAGMKVVVVKATDDGSVDLDDLKAKVETHHDRLAGIMVTYPSTHGVFEEGITDLCALVHDAGGQVYVDGANLNALVGLATSTSTRRSASRTVAVGPAWDRWRWASTWCRTCRRTLWWRSRVQGRREVAVRCPRRRTGRPASCRSAGPTSP
jgi:glycine dehydrogenase